MKEIKKLKIYKNTAKRFATPEKKEKLKKHAQTRLALLIRHTNITPDILEHDKPKKDNLFFILANIIDFDEQIKTGIWQQQTRYEIMKSHARQRPTKNREITVINYLKNWKDQKKQEDQKKQRALEEKRRQQEAKKLIQNVQELTDALTAIKTA